MLTNDAERFPSGEDRKIAYRSGAKSPTEDCSPQFRSAGRRPERASRPRYLFLKRPLKRVRKADRNIQGISKIDFDAFVARVVPVTSVVLILQGRKQIDRIGDGPRQTAGEV